ncbi:MAG: hypothetical protein ACOC16_02020 [Nanoarchaeota archaeon]
MKLSNRSLLKISLIGFLMLFIAIYFIENNYEPQEKLIQNLSMKDLDKHVKINGKILQQTTISNTKFLKISDNKSNKTIKGIIFENNHTYSKNNNYTFEGKITMYQGEIEIIINKIIQHQ